MKKIVALVLALVAVCGIFAGCKNDNTDKGAIIPINLTSEMFNVDPGRVFYDAEAMKLSSLLFEGLTRMTEDGKVEKALAKDWYTRINEEKNEYFLYIELNKTFWSDGRQVIAEHVVYAWKRLLDPATNNPAASLLYDVKNARKVKSGEMTVDDIGLAAPEDLLVEIQFEGPFDVDAFLKKAASPALVPMREDVISRFPDTWATKIETVVTNGPFAITKLGGAEAPEEGEEAVSEETAEEEEADELFTIERSTYFYLTGVSGENIKKYVTPYRFEMNYSLTADQQYDMFMNGDLHYLGYMSKENYEANAKKIKTMDIPSAYTYYFNTPKAPLDDVNVRKALATAISRDEIAAIAGRGVTAADGYVPHVVREISSNKEFRKVGGSLINTAGDVSGAKALVNGKSGKITITYRNDKAGVEAEIAKYVQGVWNDLGFTVDIKGLENAEYEKALYNGDFDVLAIDCCALTDDATSILAPFAKYYSGSVVSVKDGAEFFTPHVTGIQSDEYDAVIDKAFAAATDAEKDAAFHEAEQLLIDLCPATALYFDADYYLADKNLTGIKSTFFGARYFSKTDLKGYVPETEIVSEEE